MMIHCTIACAATRVLAYMPFLEPLDVDRYWPVLILPLALAISVVYKTIRLTDLSQVPRQAAIMAAQIIMFMMLAAVGLWAMTELV